MLKTFKFKGITLAASIVILISGCLGGQSPPWWQNPDFLKFLLCFIFNVCPTSGTTTASGSATACKTCMPGYTVGKPSCAPGFGCKPNKNNVIEACSWIADSSTGTECGWDFPNERGERVCQTSPSYCIARKELQFGYDLLISEPPIGVKNITPEIGTIIFEDESIEVVFQGTIKPDSIQFTGNLANFVAPSYKTRRKEFYSDTLNFSPSSGWSKGALQQLNIQAFDANDKLVTVPITYHVIQQGTSKIPSFNTCVQEICTHSWQAEYSIQLVGKGGVPPYKWYSTATLPNQINLADLHIPPGLEMPPWSSISIDGRFSGPATNNFYGTWRFPVILVDSIGQVDMQILVFDTQDVVAQYAACVAAGLCGN